MDAVIFFSELRRMCKSTSDIAPLIPISGETSQKLYEMVFQALNGEG